MESENRFGIGFPFQSLAEIELVSSESDFRLAQALQIETNQQLEEIVEVTRNALIAMYILFVLTLAAMARAEMKTDFSLSKTVSAR